MLLLAGTTEQRCCSVSKDGMKTINMSVSHQTRRTMTRQPHQHSKGIVTLYTQDVDRFLRIFDP